jgi:hypothetical protein
MLLTLQSDAKTPEEQIKQILQIAAILPGQTPNRKFNIPSRSNSLEHVPTRQRAPEVLETQHEIPQQDSQHEPHVQPAQHNLSQQQSQNELARQESPQGLPIRQRPQRPQALGDLIDLSDPTQQPTPAPTSNPTNPQPIPFEQLQPKAGPEKSTDTVHKFADVLPPSKLLHSVKGEPSKGDGLRRWDSETHSEDEFHDAIS